MRAAPSLSPSGDCAALPKIAAFRDVTTAKGKIRESQSGDLVRDEYKHTASGSRAMPSVASYVYRSQLLKRRLLAISARLKKQHPA